MKIKVTVELDEGVKSTTEMNISAEMVLKALSNDSGGDKPLHIMNTMMRNIITDTTKDASVKAITRIISTINKYGLLYQYDDENGERQYRPIKDVEKFNAFRKLVEEKKGRNK